MGGIQDDQSDRTRMRTFCASRGSLSRAAEWSSDALAGRAVPWLQAGDGRAKTSLSLSGEQKDPVGAGAGQDPGGSAFAATAIVWTRSRGDFARAMRDGRCYNRRRSAAVPRSAGSRRATLGAGWVESLTVRFAGPCGSSPTKKRWAAMPAEARGSPDRYISSSRTAKGSGISVNTSSP